MCGVTLNDRLRNEVIFERCEVKEDVVTCHVERMSESRLTKDIYQADMSGNAGRGRPRRTYMNLLVRFFRKIRCVVLATGLRV